MLVVEFQGKGFAKESILTILDFIFNTCGFYKATATLIEENMPSVGLLKSMILMHESTLRDGLTLSGRWCNDVKLGMLNCEYKIME